MYSNERIHTIMEILKQYNYVTVKYLINTLHYSTATINRDLNIMAKQGMIKRTYGGVELVKSNVIPMEMRYHKMRREKRFIAEAAAKHIKDGDIIFIDCATTTQYLSEFIKNRKNLTVITNNVALVSDLSENGINVICLGGKVIEPPYGLCSTETLESAMSYKANKVFFTSGTFYENGTIGIGVYYELTKTMMNNSQETFFLIDSNKIERPITRILCDFSKVDYVFSDYEFSSDVKNKFPDTVFVKVDTQK